LLLRSLAWIQQSPECRESRQRPQSLRRFFHRVTLGEPPNQRDTRRPAWGHRSAKDDGRIFDRSCVVPAPSSAHVHLTAEKIRRATRRQSQRPLLAKPPNKQAITVAPSIRVGINREPHKLDPRSMLGRQAKPHPAPIERRKPPTAERGQATEREPFDRALDKPRPLSREKSIVCDFCGNLHSSGGPAYRRTPQRRPSRWPLGLQQRIARR